MKEENEETKGGEKNIVKIDDVRTSKAKREGQVDRISDGQQMKGEERKLNLVYTCVLITLN